MTSESVPNAEASTSASLPERPGLMMGLASFALVTSLIPILSLPAAVGALVMAIRRARTPPIKFSVLVAMAMAAISIPVALVSRLRLSALWMEQCKPMPSTKYTEFIFRWIE